MENLQDVVDKFLNSDKAFLFGSRSMLNDLDITTDRDWDFAIDKKDYHMDLRSELYQYIDNKFLKKETYYSDDQHVYLLKHEQFPQITISVKRDLSLFKYVWNRIPVEYWKKYFWKSHPDLLKLFEKDPFYKNGFYIHSIDTFNLLYRMASIDMDEWL